MPNHRLLRRIEKLGQTEAKCLDKYHSLAFIMEEVGEFAQAHLEDKPVEEIREEAIDIVIAALGNFYALGGSLEEYVKVMDKKIRKWERSLDEDKKIRKCERSLDEDKTISGINVQRIGRLNRDGSGAYSNGR